MIENNMILTDKMKRRIKEEYERLQKERVDIEGDYHDKIEPKTNKKLYNERIRK